jgi:PAS domain S-box-containing protein
MAQRPTLSELLAQGDQPLLQAYLRILKAGAGLDLILVCGSNRQVVAHAGELPAENLCATQLLTNFYVAGSGSAPTAWLVADHPVEDGLSDRPEWVVVGIALDGEFVEQMKYQTGLEHTFLVDGWPAATSLRGNLEPFRTVSFTSLDHRGQGRLTLNGQPYYLLKLPLTPSTAAIKIEAAVALPVADIVATQQNLAWTLAGTILIVVGLGSGLGIFLARQISRPLARLAGAAATFSRGDLAKPVVIDTRVREVALVGFALEAARVDLKLTLGDLQREKAWTDHLLEAIVEGIVTLDRNGQIIFFSRGAERITGWSRDEALGRACDDIFQAVESHEPFSRLLSPLGRRHKIVVKLRDDRQAILAVTSAQLLPPEGSQARLVLVFRDVSEAEVMHRLMGHFLANVAHEFRTPLSALAASVELLLDQAPDLSAAELQELIISLHLGILSLQTLVDNLLEGASIEAGRFRVYMRPVELNEIVVEAKRTMQPLLNKYGQRLVIEFPADIPTVLVDPRRTVQVLVNLLSNASRYGPDAEITLGATVDKGWVRITVADRGPGIPPAHRDDLFRRFVYPAEGNDKAQYGMGLGLSVVKAIVEAQGGQVGVEDRPGGGAIFWFTLAVESET